MKLNIFKTLKAIITKNKVAFFCFKTIIKKAKKYKMQLKPFKLFFKYIGIIETVGDGIINILGLQNAANGEMFEILLLPQIIIIKNKVAFYCFKIKI